MAVDQSVSSSRGRGDNTAQHKHYLVIDPNFLSKEVQTMSEPVRDRIVSQRHREDNVVPVPSLLDTRDCN